MEENGPELQDKNIRDWDDIIPEDQRRKLEEEERRREMDDIFLLPRSRSSTKRVRRGPPPEDLWPGFQCFAMAETLREGGSKRRGARLSPLLHPSLRFH